MEESWHNGPDNRDDNAGHSIYFFKVSKGIQQQCFILLYVCVVSFWYCGKSFNYVNYFHQIYCLFRCHLGSEYG